MQQTFAKGGSAGYGRPVSGWVTSWGAALQTPDGTDDPGLSGTLLRQTVRLTITGASARLRLSNEFGRTPLRLEAVGVAPGRIGAGSAEGPGVVLAFGGQTAVSIPPGGSATSDPFPLPPGCTARAVLAVTMRLSPGEPVDGLTTHPGSRTTSHVLPAAVVPTDRPATALVGEPSLAGSIRVEHWYFLECMQVRPHGDDAAVVLLGDSLTDGRGSTTDGNDRWPDQLVERLHLVEGLAHVAVVNQAAGGNRVLRDGLGIAALTRLERDVLSCAGARWLIVFEGVNDIGTAQATVEDQQRVGDELIAAYEQIVVRCHAQGIVVYGATITPFGGHDYDDGDGRREATRQRVNAWIREGGAFDAVTDFDKAIRDPGEPRRVLPELHAGDGLHLNPSGYRVLADAVPAALFAR